MSGSCPVVRVVWNNPEGFCEINESDFNPDIHEKYEESAVPTGTASPATKTAPPKKQNYGNLSNAALKSMIAERAVKVGDDAGREDMIAALKAADE